VRRRLSTAPRHSRPISIDRERMQAWGDRLAPRRAMRRIVPVHLVLGPQPAQNVSRLRSMIRPALLERYPDPSSNSGVYPPPTPCRAACRPPADQVEARQLLGLAPPGCAAQHQDPGAELDPRRARSDQPSAGSSESSTRKGRIDTEKDMVPDPNPNRTRAPRPQGRRRSAPADPASRE